MNSPIPGWRTYLRTTLVGGAVYDIGFGLGILVMPHRLAGVLGLPMPGDELYLRFISVFLVGLALVYLLPAVEPDRFRPVIWVAVVVRTMGFLFMMAAVGFYHRPAVFLLLAAGDLSFAAAHTVGLLCTAGPPRQASKS